jgi:hypothetical protein
MMPKPTCFAGLQVQINNDTKMVSSQQTVVEDTGKSGRWKLRDAKSYVRQSSIKDFEIRIPYNCPDLRLTNSIKPHC